MAFNSRRKSNHSGLTGTVYYRRWVRDSAPTTNENQSFSNTVTVNYTNTIHVGASITNPVLTGGTWTTNCREDLYSVNTLNGNFTNQYGGPENDVYFKIESTGTLLGVISCPSDVSTKLYLFDSSFNLVTLTDVRRDCEIYQTLPTGTYYLMAEGNGNIKLHLGTYNYGDCVDSYSYFLSSPIVISAATAVSTTVSPNPAEQNITVNLSDTGTDTKKIQFYSKYGNFVMQVETTDNETTIPVNDLNADLYIIKIVIRKGTYTHRLVVK